MKHKLLAILTVIFMGFSSLSASAHDVLVEIDPEPGAILTEGTFELTLTFDNPILVIEGETNAEVSTKIAGSGTWVNHEIAIEDRVLKAQINLTDSGEYDLRWQVVSSDGHPISGESKFTLELSTPEPTADETEEPILIAPNPSDSSGGVSDMAWFYFGLALVALGAIFAPIGLLMRSRAKKTGA